MNDIICEVCNICLTCEFQIDPIQYDKLTLCHKCYKKVMELNKDV
jgi:hypothetical protein